MTLDDSGSKFIFSGSGDTFFPWGFNFVGKHGHVLEEYWGEDWAGIRRDFEVMRELGANVVRIHLQLSTYMRSPTEVDASALERLRKLIALADEIGLYLNLTGLGCYRMDAVPDWYDDMDAPTRWEVQAAFWSAVAKTCAGQPAVFCYDLMNEPVIGKPKEGEHPWLLGELGGLFWVQRISHGEEERSHAAIAAAWTEKLVAAIRRHDSKTLITVGAIPWAFVFPLAKPVFYDAQAAQHLDFVSIHVYPKSGEVASALDALEVYEMGKPIVVEETFPLHCTLDELDTFVEGAQHVVDGWIAHYFGYTIEEHAKGALPGGKTTAAFLEYWRENARRCGEPVDGSVGEYADSNPHRTDHRRWRGRGELPLRRSPCRR